METDSDINESDKFVGWNHKAMINQSAVDFYNVNAKTYELGMLADGYNGPQLAMPLCLSYLCKEDRILEVGSGSGQLGKMLYFEGFTNLHALDPAKEMLAVAKERNVYSSLTNAFLEPVTLGGQEPQSFNGVIAVGSFGPGMQTPEAFSLFLELLKPGGVVIFGTRELWMYDLSKEDYPLWNWDGYAYMETLVAAGRMKILHKEIKANHCNGFPGIYCAFQAC